MYITTQFKYDPELRYGSHTINVKHSPVIHKIIQECDINLYIIFCTILSDEHAGLV